MSNLSDIRKHFVCQVLNLLKEQVRVNLVEIATLECSMTGGVGNTKSISMTGDMLFTVTNWSFVQEKDSLLMQIVPVQRQEFRYAKVLEKDFRHFEFKFAPSGKYFDEVPFGSFTLALADALKEKEPKSKRAWGDLLDAAMIHEKKKMAESELSAHKDFGSW
jgi:hypothetical protein